MTMKIKLTNEGPVQHTAELWQGGALKGIVLPYASMEFHVWDGGPVEIREIPTPTAAAKATPPEVEAAAS